MACVGRRSACLAVAVIYLVCMNFCRVTGQLNLYITRKHLNNDLRMNFNTDLYIIKNGVPAELLRNPEALYSLVTPISPAVTGIEFNWYSDPQKEQYNFYFTSSDTEVMAKPQMSIPMKGFVPQSMSVFGVNFSCSGIKSGLVDMGFSLNYTTIISGEVQTASMKQLAFKVRRYCNESVEATSVSKLSNKVHLMSRAMIVGLCAAVTFLVCVSVGAALLCRHNIKQRKLQMEFEDDLDVPPKKEGRFSGLSKVGSKLKEASSKPPDSPIVYKPPEGQLSYHGQEPNVVFLPPKRHFSLRTTSHRPRLDTGGSDSSTVGLIEKDENEIEIVTSDCLTPGKSCVTEPLLLVNSPCEVTTNPVSCSYGYGSRQHCSLEPGSVALNRTQYSTKDEDLLSVLNETWATHLASVLLKKEQLELGRVLESGAFGCIWHGTVHRLNKNTSSARVEVSVKALKDGADFEAVTSFGQEAMLMKNFTHPNILSLLGVVLHRSAPLQLVLQYMKNGSLRDYLLSQQPSESKSQVVTARQLINFAVQVAKGMHYLASKRFTHRNLAAQHCMVSEDMTVKIAEFVSLRDSDSFEYYRLGEKMTLPIRWMAMEALTNRIFSEKSDVWSFGVMLWEIVTLGEIPYPSMEDDQIKEHIMSGGRLPQPSYCTDPIYCIMKNCWLSDPAARPNFTSLVNQIGAYERILSPRSVQFQLLEETNC